MDKEDWRLNTIALVSEDTILQGRKIEKGTVIKTVSIVKLDKKKFLTVPVPNATSMCLKVSYERYLEAKQIKDSLGINRSIKCKHAFESDSNAIDYAELMFESVIMAYTAVEAFVNEYIPDDYETWEKRKKAGVLERKTKKEIERFDSTSRKLGVILPEIFGVKSPKSSRCWQDFMALEGMRNRIIHMKTEDRRSSGHDVDTLWNRIHKIEAPYKQALSIIRFYIDSMDSPPRWYEKCEFKKH